MSVQVYTKDEVDAELLSVRARLELLEREVYQPDPEPEHRMFFGSSIVSNGDPEVRHPDHHLPLRRTFFQWRHRDGYLYRTVEADRMDDRLPWVSLKTPPWSEVAEGIYDGDVFRLFELLGGSGPVWLTFHHEPEDDGDPQAWVEMQRHVSFLLSQHPASQTVEFVPILMSWTWDFRSGRVPSHWMPEDAADIAGLWGIDHYREDDHPLQDTRRWQGVLSAAEHRGVHLAVGEFGTRDQTGEVIRSFYNHCYEQGLAGIAYFDSGLNSPEGPWTLEGDNLDTFRDLLQDERTARIG